MLLAHQDTAWTDNARQFHPETMASCVTTIMIAQLVDVIILSINARHGAKLEDVSVLLMTIVTLIFAISFIAKPYHSFQHGLSQ